MRSSEALEPVADAAYRFQRTGALAELAPQRADDDFHDVRAARPVVAPDVPQQRFALDGAPFALLEVAKDVEFEPGQVDVASVEHEPATGRVEHAVLGRLQFAPDHVTEPAVNGRRAHVVEQDHD